MEGTIHIFGKDIKKTTFYGILAVAGLGLVAFLYFRSRAATGGVGAATPQAAADQGGYGGGGIAVGVPNQATADAYNQALQALKDAAAAFNQKQQDNQAQQQKNQQDLQAATSKSPAGLVQPGQNPAGTPPAATPAQVADPNIVSVNQPPVQPGVQQCPAGSHAAPNPGGGILCRTDASSTDVAFNQQQRPSLGQPQQQAQHCPTGPPSGGCPPGQHWSYNQCQCRGNVNWLTTGINAVGAFFTGGATAPAAVSSAQSNLGYDPGLSGGGGGRVGSQPYYNPSAGGQGPRDSLYYVASGIGP